MRVTPAKIYFPEKDVEEILVKIKESLLTGQLTLGKHGKELEEKFASYTGTKYGVVVNSGTSSIEIPLRILGVTGKEVIVPTNTFFATPAAVLHAGGIVKFVDTDPETFSIDVNSLKKSITKNTAGVIIVHIAGVITPRIKEIQDICKQNNLFLFEDAAHAHGSTLDGKKAGTFGVAAAFSFYPTKVITSAEGGIIVTDSQKIRDEAMMYRDQGKAGFTMNIHDKLGYNWRMSELHAAVGLSQFNRLEEFIEKRNRLSRIYDEELKSAKGVKTIPVPKGVRSNYYKYLAILDKGIDRAGLKKIMREELEVGLSGEVYELPCHLQPIFKKGYKEGDFPVAEDICRRHICLPLYFQMTDDDAKFVVTQLKKALSILGH